MACCVCSILNGNMRKRTFLHMRPPAQSDQGRRCLHEETLHPWLSKMRLVKVLIRLPESSPGTHIRRYLFGSCGEYI